MGYTIYINLGTTKQNTFDRVTLLTDVFQHQRYHDNRPRRHQWFCQAGTNAHGFLCLTRAKNLGEVSGTYGINRNVTPLNLDYAVYSSLKTANRGRIHDVPTSGIRRVQRTGPSRCRSCHVHSVHCTKRCRPCPFLSSLFSMANSNSPGNSKRTNQTPSTCRGLISSC